MYGQEEEQSRFQARDILKADGDEWLIEGKIHD
jgi:hypothetical protein